MAVTFKKLLSLLGDDRKQLPFMVTLFLFLSFADILGIALIIPVIHFVIFGEIDSNFLEFFQGYFPINEVRQLDIETICFFRHFCVSSSISAHPADQFPYFKVCTKPASEVSKKVNAVLP